MLAAFYTYFWIGCYRNEVKFWKCPVAGSTSQIPQREMSKSEDSCSASEAFFKTLIETASYKVSSVQHFYLHYRYLSPFSCKFSQYYRAVCKPSVPEALAMTSLFCFQAAFEAANRMWRPITYVTMSSSLLQSSGITEVGFKYLCGNTDTNTSVYTIELYSGYSCAVCVVPLFIIVFIILCSFITHCSWGC